MIAPASIVRTVPRQVRQIIAGLEQAGFVNRGGKGSHRNFIHARGVVVTVSGKPGDDAPHYLEKQTRQALKAIGHENQ